MVKWLTAIKPFSHIAILEGEMGKKIHILEEHIYRWTCPVCGHYNTAYYKEVPKMINCTNCPGCEYNNCRVNVPVMERQDVGCKMQEARSKNPASGFQTLASDFDLERMNFLAWYRDASVEDIATARRNNAAKLDELTRKYEAEINLMEIIMPPRRDTAPRVHIGNAYD